MIQCSEMYYYLFVIGESTDCIPQPMSSPYVGKLSDTLAGHKPKNEHKLIRY